ncbi:Serine/threonine-protein phosphatase bsl2 [Datura stramonium]|uniref:Serine/threonine-protein phosphatase bsl2 n=1 Tax=Datura stramonium TaxID=4076 RepID=A0ABS8TQZ2_DATST|nr:Serine/threonine-protein phosphatase bsl2 [Datura stramonium]
MDVDSTMSSESDHHQNNGASSEQLNMLGPRCAPTYSLVHVFMEKKEYGPGSRYGHKLTVVTAVGEEGYPNYIGPRPILFGGATTLEENSAASRTPSAGSAGIHIYSNRLATIPDFSMMPNLEKLNLSNFKNFVEVHESLGTLTKLRYLNLSHCSKLKSQDFTRQVLPDVKQNSNFNSFPNSKDWTLQDESNII